MLESLMDYRTPIDLDGKMNYKLVLVHAPCEQDFQEHIKKMAYESHERFGPSIIELERYPEDAIIGDIAQVVYSYHGQIDKETQENHGLGTTLKNTVLIGTSFGNCHFNAMRYLINFGVSEVHIPLDGTNGFSCMGYPEDKKRYELDKYCNNFTFRVNPKLDVTKSTEFLEVYKKSIMKRGDYQIFVPNTEKPFQQDSNGTKPHLLVVFHKSWEDMMNIFNSHTLR